MRKITSCIRGIATGKRQIKNKKTIVNFVANNLISASTASKTRADIQIAKRQIVGEDFHHFDVALGEFDEMLSKKDFPEIKVKLKA